MVANPYFLGILEVMHHLWEGGGSLSIIANVNAEKNEFDGSERFYSTINRYLQPFHFI